MNYNNSFTPENYIMNNYNLSKSENLMNYVKNINNLNKKYTREKEINDLENDNNPIKNNIEENEILPERSLSNYINNKFLSDAILKLKENEFYIHKIVLCSCSDYINNQFISNPQQKEKEKNEENKESKENIIDNKDMAIINFPEIIPSSFGGGNRLNCIDKILKYCYSNQVFKSIESDINQYNIFTLLELSHCLGIKTLKLNLENKIMRNYLDKDNVAKLALESKIFDLHKLNKECINFIIQNFKEVKIFKNDILDLDYDTFKQIMSSEQINIDKEKDISDFVINYIKNRRELPDEIKEKDEKKENNNKEEEKKEEIKKEEEKEEEKEKEKQKEKNENDVNEKWKNDLLKLKESVKKRKLTKEEEKELIMCIRFNNLSHTELVRLTNELIMDEYKDLLLKSLSLKLNAYEEMENNENKEININQRYYSPYQNINEKKKNFYYSQNNIFNDRNNIDFLNNKSVPNPKYSYYQENPKLYTNNLANEENEYFKGNNRNNYKNYNNNSRNFNTFYRNSNIIDSKDNDEEKYKNIKDISNEENNEEYYNIKRNNKFNDNRYDDYNNENEENLLSSQFFDINNKREKEKINRYRQMIKSEDIKMANNKIEQSSFSLSNKQLKYPLNYNIKFKYKYDFDRNGIFYYIGTYGLSREYQNPHDVKLVKAFGSSLLSGYFSDFVGRNIANLCTENEENSFFGVDLGPNRYLLPTLYSIRNRDSSSNVLLNWDLQGSNDKIHFTILDKRRFSIENENESNKEQYRRYRNLLKEPKTTSTWGISKKVREIYPNGFRYFLLKQFGKNSSGNYNLAISGFEMYGEGIGSGWVFS